MAISIKELAASIIDMVEDQVQKQHPELNLDTPIAKECGIESRDYIQPAVVCGEGYYELEDAIVEKIEEWVGKK